MEEHLTSEGNGGKQGSSSAPKNIPSLRLRRASQEARKFLIGAICILVIAQLIAYFMRTDISAACLMVTLVGSCMIPLITQFIISQVPRNDDSRILLFNFAGYIAKIVILIGSMVLTRKNGWNSIYVGIFLSLSIFLVLIIETTVYAKSNGVFVHKKTGSTK